MGRSGSEYTPDAFAGDARTRPVSSLVAVTVAPGRTACVESRTVPRMVAVDRSASAGTAARSRNSVRPRQCLRIRPPFARVSVRGRGLPKRTSESGIIYGVLLLSRPISLGRVTSAAGFLLLSGLLTACGSWGHDYPPTIRRENGLNVLLITVDTLNSDAVGAYGQPGAVTPWNDRLAAAVHPFTNSHAHNVVTLPSHANILSGRLPNEHGVRDNAGFRFPPRLDTLATILKSQGYQTGAFVSAFPLES